MSLTIGTQLGSYDRGAYNGAGPDYGFAAPIKDARDARSETRRARSRRRDVFGPETPTPAISHGRSRWVSKQYVAAIATDFVAFTLA